ncbi:DUF4303 domain-containing protein [Thalassoglobus sp. JC818]|uniref:DUF4303 domain-containing protein n=1 Tax=Thalassoglobus sp. JC818 TaxID=3232136 RepID=UPI003459DCCE
MRSNFARLANASQAIVSTALKQLQQDLPGERFYGFALCVDADATSCYWSANSEESLIRYAEAWKAKTVERFPDSSVTLDQAIGLHRDDPSAWTYDIEYLSDAEATTQSQRQLNGIFGEIWTAAENSWLPNIWRTTSTRKKCLRALSSGINQYRAISKQDSTDQSIVLLVWINDPDDPAENQMLARLTNSESQLAGFFYEPEAE